MVILTAFDPVLDARFAVLSERVSRPDPGDAVMVARVCSGTSISFVSLNIEVPTAAATVR